MPSVVVLGLNRFGERVYDYLTDHDDTDVLALLTEPEQYETIRKLEPAYLVSAGFRHVIPADVLEVPSEGAINLHPSYLPYNRGANPDVWSIVRDGPAGVSIHRMTPDVDQGPLLARRQVAVEPDDTARSLRKRLDDEMTDLFVDTWDRIYSGELSATSQRPDEGTTNYSDEFEQICEFDLEETMRVGDTIDRLRALSFPPYHNAYFERDGTRYYMQLSITPEEDATVPDNEWDTPTLF